MHRFQDSIRRLRAFLAARLLERKNLPKDVARSKAKLFGNTRYAFRREKKRLTHFRASIGEAMRLLGFLVES